MQVRRADIERSGLATGGRRRGAHLRSRSVARRGAGRGRGTGRRIAVAIVAAVLGVVAFPLLEAGYLTAAETTVLVAFC
jgi:hypothetical protein